MKDQSDDPMIRSYIGVGMTVGGLMMPSGKSTTVVFSRWYMDGDGDPQDRGECLEWDTIGCGMSHGHPWRPVRYMWPDKTLYK